MSKDSEEAEGPPNFTIDASDAAFVGTVLHYRMFVGAQLGMAEDQRAERLEALDTLIKDARAYQQEKGKRKPELDKKRHWATVK